MVDFYVAASDGCEERIFDYIRGINSFIDCSAAGGWDKRVSLKELKEIVTPVINLQLFEFDPYFSFLENCYKKFSDDSRFNMVNIKKLIVRNINGSISDSLVGASIKGLEKIAEGDATPKFIIIVSPLIPNMVDYKNR